MGKEISITIKAVNQTKAAFAQVKASMASFGKGDIGGGFSKMGAAFKQFGQTAGMVAKAAVRGLGMIAGAATAASAAVIAVGKKAVDAYRAQAQADAKLEQALRNSGYAAGFTATELKKVASELQKTTGASDDSTESLMAVLAVSGKIRGDNFRRATLAAVDMGAALKQAGEGGEEAAAVLAKALEQPEEGLTKLKRAGVQFTQAQEDQIKAMTEAGDVAGAQAIILSEVERRYQGTAEAMHKEAGAIKDLQNSYGDMMEQLGKAIDQSSGFKDMMKSVADAAQQLSESGYIELWADRVATAMGAVMKAVKPVNSAISGFVGKKVRQAQELPAFLGAFVGTEGGIADRFGAGMTAAEKVRSGASDAEDLAAIKAKAKAETEAKLDAEKKAMAAAAPGVKAADEKEERDRLWRQGEDYIKDKMKGFADFKQKEDERQKLIEEHTEIVNKEAKAREQIEADATKRTLQAEREKFNELKEMRERASQDMIDAAERAAQAAEDALAKRRAMGVPGSKEWRENMAAAALGEGGAEGAKERGTLAKWRAIAGLDEGATVQQITDAALNKGKHVSKRDKELMARAMLGEGAKKAKEDVELAAFMERMVEQGNELKERDLEKKEKEQAKKDVDDAIKESRDSLKDIQRKIEKMGAVT
jgi:hypothetical protein